MIRTDEAVPRVPSSKCNWMQQDCLRVLVPCLQPVYIMFDISNSVVQSFNLQGEEEETLRTECPCESSDLLHSRVIRGTIVGVATSYGLDGLGCEPRYWDKNFLSTPVHTSPGAHPGGFLAAERPGSGIYRSLLPSAKVEKSIANFYFPSVPRRHIMGRPLPYTFG